MLGTFTAAFVYSLLALATVRDEPEGFVPVIAVAGGLLLGVAGIGVLIYFVHHIAQSIRVEQVVARIAAELEEAVDRLFPAALGREPDERQAIQQLPGDFEDRVRTVHAPAAGYIRGIDAARLMNDACGRELLVRLRCRPGDFVYEGTALACAYPAERLDHKAAAALAAAFSIGLDRTPLQDADHVLRQLVQIALRALSPAVNDPFTAFECLNRLTQGLRRAASRYRPSRYRFDEVGRLRVIAEPESLLPMAIAALDPIARAGADNGQVVSHLLAGVAEIIAETRYPEDRDGLLAFAERIKQDGDARIRRTAEREQVERAWAGLPRSGPFTGPAVKTGQSPASNRLPAGSRTTR